MAAKNVGTLIKEARTKAGLSQDALAKQIDGVTAADISKAERGEKELSAAALKAIAKATGVTQKSLLEAPKGGTGSSSGAKKTTSASTTTAKKTGTTAKKTSSSAKKTSTTAKKTTAVELTSAEKTMLNAYRKADADAQKMALSLLKGENDVIVSMLLQKLTGGAGANAGSGLMGLLGNLGKK